VMAGFSSGDFGRLNALRNAELDDRQEEGSVMRRSASGLAFLFFLLAAAPSFAQLVPRVTQPAPQVTQPGPQASQPGPQVSPPATRTPQQGSSFDRLSTVRHEVAASPALPSESIPSRSQTTSLGQSQTASRPASAHLRTAPHTFFPGMRSSQGPNKNVPQIRGAGRAGLMTPGMFLNSGAARTSPARSPGKTSR